MNPLQSGTPANQLSPQSFRNTNQTNGLQASTPSSNLQRSQGQVLNSSTSSTRLQVVDGQPQPVLAVQDQTGHTNQTVVIWGIGILLFSLILAVYFFQKSKHSQ